MRIQRFACAIQYIVSPDYWIGPEMLLHEANNTEEPCAGKPHKASLGGGRVIGRPNSMAYKH